MNFSHRCRHHENSEMQNQNNWASYLYSLYEKLTFFGRRMKGCAGRSWGTKKNPTSLLSENFVVRFSDVQRQGNNAVIWISGLIIYCVWFVLGKQKQNNVCISANYGISSLLPFPMSPRKVYSGGVSLSLAVLVTVLNLGLRQCLEEREASSSSRPHRW